MKFFSSISEFLQHENRKKETHSVGDQKMSEMLRNRKINDQALRQEV